MPSKVTRRPVLFAVSVTLAFVLSLIVLAVAQKSVPKPVWLEAVGALGRTAIGAAALLWLAKLGWRRWIAGSAPKSSWLLILVPLLYVVVVYPPLFSGAYRVPTEDGALLSMVAANGFAAGVMEELVFRGLALGALLLAWGVAGRGLWRALVVSSLLFSLPHGLNVVAGAEPLTTAAQLIWAFLLGMVFGGLTVAGGSVWPVAVLHGAGNAFIHVSRYGQQAAMDPFTAALLALAPLPLLWYSTWVLRRSRQLRPSPFPE